MATQDIEKARIFNGSWTNGRLEDLRLAGAVVRGQSVHPKVRAMVVPGSASVKRQAEAEGLDAVFRDAGFEWRDAGCSMCLGVDPHIPRPGEHCAPTTKPNIAGRHGGGRGDPPVIPPQYRVR